MDSLRQIPDKSLNIEHSDLFPEQEKLSQAADTSMLYHSFCCANSWFGLDFVRTVQNVQKDVATKKLSKGP